jgi:spore coat polysaccharide biosynthesis protein SpsF
MRSLAAVPADIRALLTDTRSIEELRPLAEAEGYGAFGGPDEDVLARYCLACREFGVSTVIRATGDNPLTSARLATDILGVHRAGRADLSHYLGCPWGMGVEVVEASALFAAENDARAADEREHITTFLYRHRQRFTILEPQAPSYACLPEAVVTVDTQDDYDRVSRIFETLWSGEPVEAEQVAAWFRRGAGND